MTSSHVQKKIFPSSFRSLDPYQKQSSYLNAYSVTTINYFTWLRHTLPINIMRHRAKRIFHEKEKVLIDGSWWNLNYDESKAYLTHYFSKLFLSSQSHGVRADVAAYIRWSIKFRDPFEEEENFFYLTICSI